MRRYLQYVVINAASGAVAKWVYSRRAADEEARALAMKHGGRFIVARVLAYSEVTIVENKNTK
jgi:hypothetical protein